MMDYCLSGPNIFVTSKCAVVSFLCALSMLFQRNNSECRGEAITLYPLRAHSLQFTHRLQDQFGSSLGLGFIENVIEIKI